MSTRPSAANTPTTATTSPVEDPSEADKFTGHDWDSASRLYYTAYRYYSPDANRWLTRDPLGMVDGPNVYAHVNNGPINWADPYGRQIYGDGVGTSCGIESCNRPKGDSGWFWLYIWHLDHSYIRFPDGTGWWGTPDDTPNHPYRLCAQTRKKTRGKMPNGQSCESATCADITKCIRESNYWKENNYSPWPWGANCHDATDDILSKCCLREYYAHYSYM